MDQIFILILSNDISNLKSKIREKFEEFSEDDLAYFDMDNIFFLNNTNEEYKKILMPILKVFRYFNQLGDSFFKQLPDLVNIENYKGEIEHLFHTHYFNILLSGMTGTGKSTFINRIMGEKKAYTLKTKSAGTYRNNYYIHKKYPIKIIDVCGFAQGSEGDENKKKLQSVYQKNTNEIIIDEPMNDIFTFYGDKRNYIHLLLYFTSFRGKYDVIPGELPIILEAMSHNIPIIFVVNKCPDNLFKENSRALKTFEKEIREVRKDPEQIVDFSECKTFPINCITKKGFDKFLEGIYDQFKQNIIDDNVMEGIKNGIVPQKELFSLFKNLFGVIKPEDVLLNESLLNSVKDIKLLVVKIAAYYSNELGFWKSLGF
jgi:GTPase SAR1 family protein